MKVHVIGGGTMVHVRPHFSLCAPAYGSLAKQSYKLFGGFGSGNKLHLSKMAGGTAFNTNDDLKALIDEIVADPEPSIVFLTAAVCDWEPRTILTPQNAGAKSAFGKSEPRLMTKDPAGSPVVLEMTLKPAEKFIGRIRSGTGGRKDIFLVACKTTTGASYDEMFTAGLTLLKTTSANLVLVNDIHLKQNIIVTPEQARYGQGSDRDTVVRDLVTMAKARAGGTFTRSTVVPGDPVPWQDERVHASLRTVVDHCIAQGAYKDLLGRNATVGHFAQKLDSNRFLTSRRNSNFNDMARVGLVEVEAGDDNTSVVAHGFKPSVGGQSQRIIFREHEGLDCIVHFHCPPKEGVDLPTKAQWANECGSHECGQNTSKGLTEVEPGIKVVYLDQHGPNIVFRHDIDPERVISFIDRTFDLSRHTGQGAVT